MTMKPTTAREILSRALSHPSRLPDFYELRWHVVARLLDEAKAYGYRHRSAANGLRARYFYAYVCRQARIGAQ